MSTENLPALQRQVNEQIADQEKSEKDLLLRLQKYSKLNNSKIEEGKLKDHPFIKGVRYLPISFMEMSLDRIYFGLWSTDNFRWELAMNEVVASIELKVFHPVAKVWITRIGSAAIKVMTDSIPVKEKEQMDRQQQNKWHLNMDNKKPNALEAGGFAHLKADCFRNAVLSLGQHFGRDVNREHTDEFSNLITDIDEQTKQYRKHVSDALDLCQDEELKAQFIERILEAEKEGKNTPEFYQIIYFELNPGG